MIWLLLLALLLQQPPPLSPARVTGPPPHTPSDVDLPRPHPVEYPPVRRPGGRGGARAAPASQRGLYWTQDSQALETVKQYTFALYVDSSTTATVLAASCLAQPTAMVFGCSARFSPAKGTHTYTLETRCSFCAPTSVRAQPFTFTY